LLKEELSLKNLVCTRLKTKFNSYASFHIFVNKDKLPLITNTSMWPNGCVITPFYGKLTPDQVGSSSSPAKPISVGAPLAADVMSPS
jgi:hypothetical protein